MTLLLPLVIQIALLCHLVLHIPSFIPSRCIPHSCDDVVLTLAIIPIVYSSLLPQCTVPFIQLASLSVTLSTTYQEARGCCSVD